MGVFDFFYGKRISGFLKPKKPKGKITEIEEKYYRKKRYIMEWPLNLLSLVGTAVLSVVVLASISNPVTAGIAIVAISAALFIPNHFVKTIIASRAKAATTDKFRGEGHSHNKEIESKPSTRKIAKRARYLENGNYVIEEYFEDELESLKENVKADNIAVENKEEFQSEKYKGVGADLEVVNIRGEYMVRIDQIFSAKEFPRFFNADGNAKELFKDPSSELKGKHITGVIINGEFKDITSLVLDGGIEKAISIFHGEGDIIFQTHDGKKYGCERNEKSVFVAKNPSPKVSQTRGEKVDIPKSNSCDSLGSL